MSPVRGRSGDSSFSWCSGGGWRLRAHHTPRPWARDPLEKGNGPQSMSLYCGRRERSPFHPASEIGAGGGDPRKNFLTLPQFKSFHLSASLCFCFLYFSVSLESLSRHPSIFLHLLVLAVGSGEASEALVGLCPHRKTPLEISRTERLLLLPLDLCSPESQVCLSLGDPPGSILLAPGLTSCLKHLPIDVGGLDGVEKPFPLCVTCHTFLSPGQVAVYPPHPKGPPRAGLCHRWSTPPFSDPTSLLPP